MPAREFRSAAHPGRVRGAARRPRRPPWATIAQASSRLCCAPTGAHESGRPMGRRKRPSAASLARGRQRLRAAHVVTVKILLILPAQNLVQPGTVGLIPVNGLSKPALKIPRPGPAQFSLQLAAIESVAAIMRRPVADKVEQGLSAVQPGQDLPGHNDVFQLTIAPDVVDLPLAP